MIYDIIGDIHGRMDKLHGLLTLLGYRHNGVFYAPPSGHQAIFVGDFIDRGGAQLAVLETVFAMLDHGAAQAVMGNHEYNALMYAHPHPDNSGYCRPHTAHNIAQHQAFLDEIPFGSQLHRYWLTRFFELPLWLSLPKFHVVHATWDSAAMQTLSPILDARACLSPNALSAIMGDTVLFDAMESVLKGVESDLPDGVYYHDKNGQRRTRTRLNWWQGTLSHQLLSAVACLPTATLNTLPPDATTGVIDFQLKSDRPVFIGHYWFDGAPALLANDIVCMDYSAATTGHLTAYRFDSDNPTLSSANFIQYKAP